MFLIKGKRIGKMKKLKIDVKQLFLWTITILLSLFLAGKWSTTEYYFDTDLLWHLKIGEDILNTGTIFLENNYTWLDGTIWTQQEWLFDIILHIIVINFGLVGFYAIHIVSQFSLIGLSIKKNKYHFNMLAPIVFLLMYYYIPFNNVNRPAEYSTYMFVLMMWLYDKKWKMKPLVYFLCGVVLANFHCGAAVPLLVMMLMLVGIDIILNFAYMKVNGEEWTITKKFILQYLISCTAFVIGLFVNPYGFNQVKNMFGVMGLNSTQYINEWKPFSSSDFIPWIILFGIAISFGYALCKHKWHKTDVRNILIMCAFLVLSVTSLKAFIMFFYLFIMYGYKYVDELIWGLVCKLNIPNELRFKKFHLPLRAQLKGKKQIVRALVPLCMIFAIFVATYNQGSWENFMTHERERYVSDGSIAKLKQIETEEETSGGDVRLLNAYVTGNYLLYYGIDCFIDARQQPYAKEFGWSSAVDDYFDTGKYDSESLNTFFEKYDFNYVLCNREYNINWYMQQMGNTWSLIYSDDHEIYIWKRMG